MKPLTISILLLATATICYAQFDVSTMTSCFASNNEPAKPRSLSFCHKFNDLACCAPTHDFENNDNFDRMYNLGLSCRLRGDVRDSPLAKIYCINCDPEQPQYLRPEYYVPTAAFDGDPWTLGNLATLNKDDSDKWIADPTLQTLFANPPDFLNLNDTMTDIVSQLSGIHYDEDTLTTVDETMPSSYDDLIRSGTTLVCREWVEQEYGLEGTDSFFDVYKKCGLQKSTPCTDVHGKIIPGRDRYTCGDDPSLPAVFFTDFEQFFNTDDMATPNLAGEYGFKLVSNRVCTDDELEAIKSDSTTILSIAKNITAYVANNDEAFNIFNPRCLRTRDQLLKYGVSPFSGLFNLTAYVDSGAKFDYLDDVLPESFTQEKCFNSASSITIYSAMLLVFAAIALFFL